MRELSGASLCYVSLIFLLVLVPGCGEESPDDGFFMTQVGVDQDGLVIAGTMSYPWESGRSSDVVILRSTDGEDWTTEIIPGIGIPWTLAVGPDAVIIGVSDWRSDEPAGRILVSQGGAPFAPLEALAWEGVSSVAHAEGEYWATTFDIPSNQVSLASSTDLVDWQPVDWQVVELDGTMWNPKLHADSDGTLWIYGEGSDALRRPRAGDWEIATHGLANVSTMGTVHGQTVGLGWNDGCFGEDPDCLFHQILVWNKSSFELTPIDKPSHYFTDILEVDQATALEVNGDIVRVTGDFATGTRDKVWTKGKEGGVYDAERFGDAIIAVGEVVLRSDDDGVTWRELAIPDIPSMLLAGGM